jgi:hypothetical protein
MGEDELLEVVKSGSCVRDGRRGWGTGEEAVSDSASDALNLRSPAKLRLSFFLLSTTTTKCRSP